jgi:hypothetical protein
MQAKTKGSARIIQKSAGWACARSGKCLCVCDPGVSRAFALGLYTHKHTAQTGYLTLLCCVCVVIAMLAFTLCSYTRA